MDRLVTFFDGLPDEPAIRSGLLIGGIVLFWVMEGILPLFTWQYKKVRHAGKNILFTSFTMVIGFLFAGVLLWASEYTNANGIGLLHIVAMPLWLKMVVGVLLLDMIGAWLAHYVEHRVTWMWKFHLVHHSDTHVDVTTGLRHHPGETVIRMFFTCTAVFVVGAPIWLVMLYQSLSVIFAHLTHANVNVPKRMDRVLSWVFVTPNMHKVHHHYALPLTDTNFGNIFSVWDRLFGTFAQVEDTSTLRYGIDTHMDPQENDNLANLFKIPFQPYRPTEGPKVGEGEPIIDKSPV